MHAFCTYACVFNHLSSSIQAAPIPPQKQSWDVLHVNMCVCVCVCVCAHVFGNVLDVLQVNMYVCIHVFGNMLRVKMYVWIDVYLFIVNVCMWVDVYLFIVNVRMWIDVYLFIVNVCMYSCTYEVLQSICSYIHPYMCTYLRNVFRFSSLMRYSRASVPTCSHALYARVSSCV